MRQAMVVFLIINVLIMTGCNSNEALIEVQQNKLKELDKKIVELEETIKKQQKVIDEYGEEFSYLKGFTEEEIEAYERFFDNKDVQHLSGFSPEKIVLLYFHSVVVDDVAAIYSLTFNDGKLPDLATFRQRYYTEGLQKHELETTLDFRYFNSIKVRENDKSENEVTVQLSVDFGLYHPIVILGLKKEKGIWKMDILHLLEYFKNKNN